MDASTKSVSKGKGNEKSYSNLIAYDWLGKKKLYFWTIQNKTLWVTLAAISLKNDQLEISEEAYCASLQVDKVEYLQHIKVKIHFPLSVVENNNQFQNLGVTSLESRATSWKMCDDGKIKWSGNDFDK